MGLFSCCTKPKFVPPDHASLSSDELRALYERCLCYNAGRLIVHGVMARADTKNNNKRVYPKHVLRREVRKFKYARVRTGTAIGELDHPSYSSQYFKHLNLGNITHQVLEVKWQDGLVYGTIEILPTPSGLLLWELYAQGIKLGVSSRGWATLKSDAMGSAMLVDDDLELITFDFVTEPSTSDAFLLPLARQYSRSMPDQTRVVQLAHLGYGSILMEDLALLPSPQHMVAAIKKLRKQHSSKAKQTEAAQKAGYLTAPVSAVVYGPGPAGGSSSLLELKVPRGLEQMELCSHYSIHEEPFISQEPAARQYKLHLAMFATKAHLDNIKAQSKSLGAAELMAQQQAQHQQQASASAVSRIAAGTRPWQPGDAAGVPALQPALHSAGVASAASVGPHRRSSAGAPADTGSPITDHEPQGLQWTSEHSSSLAQLELGAVGLPAAEEADSDVANGGTIAAAAGPAKELATATAAAALAAPPAAGPAQGAVPGNTVAQSQVACGAGQQQHDQVQGTAAAAQPEPDPVVQAGLLRARQTLNAFAVQYSSYQAEMRKALKLAPALAAADGPS